MNIIPIRAIMGKTREHAYRVVQRNAMKAWLVETDFATLLKADPDVRGKLSDKDIAASFDLKYHLKHVDTIFSRVFGKSLH